jgi:hypothetical protein
MGRFCVLELALWICSSLPSAVCKHMRVNSRNTKDYLLDWDMIVFRVARSVLIRVALIVRDLFSLPFGIACTCGDGIQLQITTSDTNFIQRRVELQTHDVVIGRGDEDFEFARGGRKVMIFRARAKFCVGECQCESCNE